MTHKMYNKYKQQNITIKPYNVNKLQHALLITSYKY